MIDPSNEKLIEYLASNYIALRELDDGSVAAIGDLMFTRAIYLGVSVDGFARRFCFENRALASKRFDELMSEDDVPAGYTARR